MQKRGLVIFCCLLLVLGGVAARIYTLTQQQLAQAARQQATETVTVAKARGTLYDCRLRPLVNTETEVRAAIAPFPSTLAVLGKSLDSTMLAELTDRTQDGHPTVAVLPMLLPPIEGVLRYDAPVRYGTRLLAPHTVGYLDGDGLHGVVGAEQAYDDRLSACEGSLTVTYAVDGMGAVLDEVQPQTRDTLGDADAGVALTLDADIQRAAEEAAAASGLTHGAVVVLDAATAAVRASCSLPSFQPDTVAACLRSVDAPLLDRTLCNYNVGSVFKLVVAAAALEAGVPVERRYTCDGSCLVDGIRFHCHDPLGHNTVDMAQAFAQSCNPYFIQLAAEIGADKVYDMACRLGFCDTLYLTDSRIALKSARPVLPQKDTLKIPAALANFAIGQGDLLASPMHIAQMTAAIACNGLLSPPMLTAGQVEADGTLTEAETVQPRRVFSEQTAQTLRRLMRGVCTDGTGTEAQPFHGQAGGKSGTAETGWEQNGDEVIQSWFTGFYPSEQPRYAVTVLAENSEAAGLTAAPVFRAVCEAIYYAELTAAQTDF